jgi:hypothetical protein
MNNLKLPFKIILVNIAIAFVLALMFLFGASGGSSNAGEFALSFGLVCLGTGLINLFVGFIMLFTNTPEWRNGFLLSGAVLLLLSGISCGGGAAFA